MKLYTKTVCPKCIWIKSELKRSGLDAHIINIDQDEEARERLIESGIMSVPAMEVDGVFICDPEEMVKRLEQVSA
ncbi:MAG: glutaredoxin [Paenibacillus sp.]|jgi:glutaredoxin|nr:glutaredoxin [Paenibacillus sp.]